MDKSTTTERLASLFQEWAGMAPELIESIPGGGSEREYFRISAGQTRAIGTWCPDIKETNRFIEMSVNLTALCGIHVPEIYAVSSDRMAYLQEDCGDTSLFSLLGNMTTAEEYLSKAVDDLARMHNNSELTLVADECNPPFNYDAIIADLHYFKFCFLKPLGIAFDDAELEADFRKYAASLCNCERYGGFMYRDCQSRNILITPNGDLAWIDFQGARRGPCEYDLASLLWQAKANLPDDMKERLADRYANARVCHHGCKAQILSDYHKIIPLRVMQTLGAYGFRGLIEKKSHFIESIALGIANLNRCAGQLNDYPQLYKVALSVASAWKALNPFGNSNANNPTFTLRVESFSYKKGYPPELKGNGGGFIFDCRYMHNPGRYAEYRHLTGLDADVINFLEERGEVTIFVSECVDMVSKAVERYMSRGFSDLFVGFGCTGGQHRSVYCAEHFATRIKELFPTVRVEVNHRAQHKHHLL